MQEAKCHFDLTFYAIYIIKVEINHSITSRRCGNAKSAFSGHISLVED